MQSLEWIWRNTGDQVTTNGPQTVIMTILLELSKFEDSQTGRQN